MLPQNPEVFRLWILAGTSPFPCLVLFSLFICHADSLTIYVIIGLQECSGLTAASSLGLH